MKRSNDYIQGHDGYKKPRVAQGYNNYQAAPGAAVMGATAGDMYGGGYGANPMMMMSAYSQMSGAGYNGNELAMAAPFQQYPTSSFGAPYNATPFQVSFPPPRNPGPPSIRTVYVGNVPSDAKIHDVLDLVQTGNVESARLLPEKNCAFISFVDAGSAAAFHQRAAAKKLRLGVSELRVGWGKASPVPNTVLHAVQQGATRNIFVGSVDDSITEDSLMADFSTFGTVEDIKIMREKSIAFVHFTHIASAMKAVASLPHDMRYSGRRINYGKDRCAKFSATAPASFAFGAPGYSPYGASPVSFSPKFDRQVNNGGRVGGIAGGPKPNGAGVPMSILTAEGNRTVYLGNIGPDVLCEDLCNLIRGGILSNIRYLAPKHIAFVTFVDPQSATSFFEMASTLGFVVKGRRLKVGWGQNAHTLPAPVIQALSAGATRNVYIGGVEGVADVEKLRQDFSEFGEVEMVNILKEKNCGFVNFTNILSAVKAVESIHMRPEYSFTKVNYGKDRCGNPPRERTNNGEMPQAGEHDLGSLDLGAHNMGVTPMAMDSMADVKKFDEDDDSYAIPFLSLRTMATKTYIVKAKDVASASKSASTYVSKATRATTSKSATSTAAPTYSKSEFSTTPGSSATSTYATKSFTASPASTASTSSSSSEPLSFSDDSDSSFFGAATTSTTTNVGGGAGQEVTTTGLKDGVIGDSATEDVHDWTRSFAGMATEPFEKEVADLLMAPLDPDDIEMKPGWGLAPRSDHSITPTTISREYALICRGRFVSTARGEQDYFNPNGLATASEGCKSNALMRCCKDLGIASELWDPGFIRKFKKQYCEELFYTNSSTNKKKKLWKRKDAPDYEYPWVRVK
ncbi:hypothetical protein BGZ99_010437 [Dissophora globulifera]|uniref:Mitochondrial genome maintenance protein MGM101 n=1 Tax=Dissophora globulifera TaxID=979702 RepID=A0A9P6RSP0_9FUNG|nr:hypothetical protein BGZ99_010437 [Dissophora globulifera]